MEFIKSILISFSFLTSLPVPQVAWTPRRLGYFPLTTPLVGAVIGLFEAACFIVLRGWGRSMVLRAVLLMIAHLAITGGLHMDGFIDVSDAVFSHRDRQTRLAIMSDTHVGAFAVIMCAALLLLRTGTLCELLGSPLYPAAIIFTIPLVTRTCLATLFFSPFAKEDGLARTFGAALDRRHLYVLCCLLASETALAALLCDVRWATVPLTGLVFLFLYRRWYVKNFGGITGDLMGAFVETSEALLLLTVTVVRP